MNPKEQVRLQVLNTMLQGHVGAAEAAVVLKLSERHVWRLLAVYRKEGAVALAHGNRGRHPPNATLDPKRQAVIRLATERYPGVNHTHLTELLADREGVVLSRSTVRRMLTAAGIPSPRRRRPPRHRIRRERMPQEGMLVQIDGSDHDWLEGRGPRLNLLLAVDDATSTVPYALFQPHEGTEGYFRLLHGLIQRRGIPLALYSDRHGTFQNPRGLEPGPTQFGQAMRELGIQQIFAHSPQAKGRVERTAGTFQDRLVSELRLARASSLEDANEVLARFLPTFNARFGVAPRDAASAYRPLPPGLLLDDVLSHRYSRRVARDNTVQIAWRTLQLLPSLSRPSYAGTTVEVRRRLDGTLTIWHEGVRVASQEGPPRITALRAAFLTGSNALVVPEQQPALRPRPPIAGPTVHVAHKHTGDRRSHASRSPGEEQHRPPTPRQQARWHAIQRALNEGFSVRGIAKHVGISRNTVRRYLAKGGPPANKPVEKRPWLRATPYLLTLSLADSP